MAKVGCKGERRGRRRQTVKREMPTLNLNGEPAVTHHPSLQMCKIALTREVQDRYRNGKNGEGSSVL